MTVEQFYSINWQRGNVAKLTNGKEYPVKAVKSLGKYLLLYSEEYDKAFVADYRIVVSRTSDYVEPEEVYLEHKRQKQAAHQAAMEAAHQEHLRRKEERKQKHLQEQAEAHERKLAKKQQRQQEWDAAQKAKQTKSKEVSNGVQIQSQTSEKPSVTPQAVVPATGEPKKRVRQRVRISKPTYEKVTFKKK